MLHRHCGIDKHLIYKGCNKQETRIKVVFWQYKPDTFLSHGLNERVGDDESI